MSFHLLQGVAQGGWDWMRFAGIIIAPDHHRAAEREDARSVGAIADRLLHMDA